MSQLGAYSQYMLPYQKPVNYDPRNPGGSFGAPPPPTGGGYSLQGGQPYQKPVNYDPRNPGGSFGAPGMPTGGIVPSLNLGPPPTPQPQQIPGQMPGYRPLSKTPAFGIGNQSPGMTAALMNMQRQQPQSQYGVRVNAAPPAARPALPAQAALPAQQRAGKVNIPSAPPRLGVTTHSPYAGTGGPRPDMNPGYGFGPIPQPAPRPGGGFVSAETQRRLTEEGARRRLPGGDLYVPPQQPAMPSTARDVQNLRNQFGAGGIPSISQYMGNRTGGMVGAGAPRGLAALIGQRPIPSQLPPQLTAELRARSLKRS